MYATMISVPYRDLEKPMGDEIQWTLIEADSVDEADWIFFNTHPTCEPII